MSLIKFLHHSALSSLWWESLYGSSFISAKLIKPLAVEAISALLHVVLSTLGIRHLPSPVNLFGMLVEDTLPVKLFIVAPVSPLCFFFIFTKIFQSIWKTSFMTDVWKWIGSVCSHQNISLTSTWWLDILEWRSNKCLFYLSLFLSLFCMPANNFVCLFLMLRLFHSFSKHRSTPSSPAPWWMCSLNWTRVLRS